MGYTGYFEFAGQELINHSRTVQLCQNLGIDIVRLRDDATRWVEDALLPAEPYGDPQSAPWHEPGNLDSEEFAGLLALDVSGLKDSTQSAAVTEFMGDGGNLGRSRNSTGTLVWNVALLASSEAGADFGLRWLKNRLAQPDFGGKRLGSNLRYFAYDQRSAGVVPPFKHRRRVKLTRGLSVTKRRSKGCHVLTIVTFTMQTGDPFEYGERLPQIEDLGGSVTGPTLYQNGSFYADQIACPVFDFSPVYDPNIPALVAPPTPPSLIPEGWKIAEGERFGRYWAELDPFTPRDLSVVPVFTLSTSSEARQVRVSVWAFDTDQTTTRESQCGPLWSAVVGYVPVGVDLVIDGEAQSAYTWDGQNSRLATSLLYSPEGGPVEWKSFNSSRNMPGNRGLVVTLDAFEFSPGVIEGNGGLRLAVDFVEKSD